MRKSFGFVFVFFLSLCSISQAADTLRLTIPQADSIFLRNNYLLLASSMNVKAQEAQVLQAKLYPNPIFTADVNAYDFENEQAFHVGTTGQKFFQLEQLILLGGKRKAEIDLAKTNAEIAALEFQDLVRTLKYELHSSLYALSQQEFLLNKFDTQLALLDNILEAYKVQSDKGNIPLKDLVRLKGVYLNLSNDRAELYQYYLNELAQVQIILQTSNVIKPVITDDDLETIVKLKTVEDLQSEALVNRADYLISVQNKTAAEQYFKLQKRMAIPDVNAFANYDQRSGAFNNQVNIGFSIPLPVWNRNKGNIRSAQFQVDNAQYTLDGVRNEIMVNISNQFALYNRTVAEFQKMKNLYDDDFDFTLQAMSENFQKQNVSVLEFVDFFESYSNSLAEIARIKIQLAVSAEQLNHTIGKEIF